MATTKDIRNAAMAKATARPSRPSMAKMRQAKAAVTKGKTAKAATPKMVGKKKSSGRTTSSLAKVSPKNIGHKKGAKGTRHRSATGSAARGLVAGRHTPANLRYKTGWWRPVRQSWMTNEVWDAYKAINRFRNKAMSKGMRNASLGKQIYGKEGPGHAGYGTGKLQMWADKILRRGDGSDPHMIDVTKWFAGAAAAIDFHNGKRTFEDLMKDQKKDSEHFMRIVIERMKDYIPELKKLSKRGVNDIIRNRFYTAQYGPDGRAK